MKSKFKYAGVLALSLAVAFGANAASKAQKIGYINVAQVLHKMPQTKRFEQRLAKEFKARKSDLEQLNRSFIEKNKKLQRDGATLSKAEFVAINRDLEKIKLELNLKGRAYQEDLMARQQEEMVHLQKKVQKAILKVAPKEGYDFVIDSGAVLYAKPNVDLTKKVILELK